MDGRAKSLWEETSKTATTLGGLASPSYRAGPHKKAFYTWQSLISPKPSNSSKTELSDSEIFLAILETRSKESNFERILNIFELTFCQFLLKDKFTFGGLNVKLLDCRC